MSRRAVRLDYEQPLFFRSLSSMKQNKKERAKIGDVTDCEKIGAARSLR